MELIKAEEELLKRERDLFERKKRLSRLKQSRSNGSQFNDGLSPKPAQQTVPPKTPLAN